MLATGSQPAKGSFPWPVIGPITSPYCEQRAWESCHPGIDIGVGSGTPIPLRGGARLAVVVLVPAYDSAGQPTYRPVNVKELTNVTGYRTFRQVAWAGSFEGRTTVGLGVRARLPFRVFTLAGPGDGSRLVIDVAHTW